MELSLPPLCSASTLSWQSPGGQCVWCAMGCILTAPVDVPVQAGQHHTPQAVPWKFWPPTHQQCSIIDCPCEVLEMVGIIHIQQGQGIWHTHPLHSMPLLGASQCGESQNLVSYNDLLIHASLLLHWVEYVK